MKTLLRLDIRSEAHADYSLHTLPSINLLYPHRIFFIAIVVTVYVTSYIVSRFNAQLIQFVIAIIIIVF